MKIDFTTLDSFQALMYVLIEQLGGRSAVTKILTDEGYTYQSLSNWISRGKVPLKDAVKVGRLLGISPYLLNYYELEEMVPKGKTWNELIKNANITNKNYKLKLLRAE